MFQIDQVILFEKPIVITIFATILSDKHALSYYSKETL